MKKQLSSISIACVALAMPAARLAATLTNLLYKKSNTGKIDITNKVAYQHQTMLVGVIVFAILLIVAVVFGVLSLKKAEQKRLGQLSLILVAVVSIITVGIYASQKAIDKTEKNYTKKAIQQLYPNFQLGIPKKK